MTTKISEAESYLRLWLGTGPKLATDLINGTTIHPRTLRRAARRLQITRSRRGEHGAWVWHLPPEDHLFAPGRDGDQRATRL